MTNTDLESVDFDGADLTGAQLAGSQVGLHGRRQRHPRQAAADGERRQVGHPQAGQADQAKVGQGFSSGAPLGGVVSMRSSPTGSRPGRGATGKHVHVCSVRAMATMDCMQ